MTLVTIERIAAGGAGVGRLPDGRVAFVSRTAPGDVVEAEQILAKRRYIRARLVAVREAGADRVAPQCVHYAEDHCGGCQLQHLSPDAQLRAKQRIVGDALRRIAALDVGDPEIVPSRLAWRYRSKIRLAVKHTRRGRLIGLHRDGRPDAVFEPGDCLITRERIMRLWRTLRRHAELFPPECTAVTLTEDRDGGLHVVMAGGREVWDAGPLTEVLGNQALSCWWQPDRGAARVVAGPRTGYPPMAFEQSNPELAQVIREEAAAGLGDVGGARVWDLYGGVGDTAQLLAAAGAQVWSVDVDRAAKAWAERGHHPQVHHLAGRVEDVLPQLPKPDAVVVNPPRAGLSLPVASHLNRWASGGPGRRLAYVSCDPATLARDISRMGSFGLEGVRAYDLFPQTSHVESLAVLESR
jgi:23S rRNA (uracil1939-C5)-methyltransferase